MVKGGMMRLEHKKFPNKIFISFIIVVLVLLGIFGIMVIGEPIGSEFKISVYTPDHQWAPDIAMNSTGFFVVTWESYGQDGDGYSIYARRYHSNGSPLGNEFRVNTYTMGYQWRPSIAMSSNGSYLITWSSEGQDSDGYGIYAQPFTSNGTPIGSEFRVNNYTLNDQSNPSVAMNSSGCYIISWQSYGQDGDRTGIYAQLFANNNTPLGNEFRVNTNTSDSQEWPSAAMSSNGSFLISWETFHSSENTSDIYAQRFTNNGTPIGNEFLVNTYITSQQSHPAVAMNSTGTFIIAWDSLDQDGDGYGVYAQLYLNNGTKIGSEFQVNTYTTYYQYGQSVAMTKNGDFIIAWDSIGQDGSDGGIYAQQYSNNGTRVGNEFRVNTYTISYQILPSVATDSIGNFVIVWASYGQDGDGYGIYGQMFNSTPIPEFSNLLIPIMSITAVMFFFKRKKKLPIEQK